jgi:hypothetical protein
LRASPDSYRDSEGHERGELAQAKSEAGKQANNFVLAKTSNFLYTVLYIGFYFFIVFVRFSINQIIKIEIIKGEIK